MSAKASTLWRAEGFSFVDANAGARARYRPDEARRWIDAGFRTVAEADAWSASGLSPRRAHAWSTRGFSPSEAAEWVCVTNRVADAVTVRAAGLDSATWTALADLGLEPSEARRAARCCLELARWRTHGFVAAEIALCLRAAMDLGDATAWVEEGCRVELTVAWHELGIPLCEALRWWSAGFWPEDHDVVAVYRSAKVDPATAAESLRLGVEPEDAVRAIRGGVDPTEHCEWVRHGFGVSEMVQWGTAGFTSPREAALWQDESFELDEASAWRREGFGPAEAADLREAGFSPRRAPNSRSCVRAREQRQLPRVWGW
jgi:hypothetical protein